MITVTIFANGQVVQCVVPFTVTPLPSCVFSLNCTNKIVECGTAWVFDPPVPVNYCAPAPGTPGNGVTLTNISTITNGTCPEVITATWQGTDFCGNTATCSQTVTVQDTTPPTIICSCVQSAPVLKTNACAGVVPDLCVYNSCFSDNCGPLKCYQTPTAGTVVGPGITPITLSVLDCAGNSNGCVVPFTVTVLPACGFSLVCSSNKTVECGSPWIFDPPVPVNSCAPATVTLTSLVTNGTCPQVITATWQALDACGVSATCSQTVTVVDTTPPFVNCNCLRDFGLKLLVTNACSGIIPSLCQFANCFHDNCGPLKCSQTPPPGTIVGPGVHPITVTVTDCAGNTGSCSVPFKVIATLQTNIWNTGMGGPSGNIPLAPGTPDPNYNLVSLPPGGCSGPAQVISPSSLPGAWVPDGPNSQWIGGSSGSVCQQGVYHYKLCFFLSCTDGASIKGQWTADDFGEILLNSQPTGYTVPSIQYPWSFTGWNPIEITNGFICGYNCLDFFVTNYWSSANPTGFRAELTNTFNECCCSPTQALFSVNSGMGAAGPLPIGSPDLNITLTCAPQGVQLTSYVIPPNGIWLPNGPNSQWIGPSPAPGIGGNPGGVYCYTLNFNVPCPSNVPIRAVVSGQWSADDTGTIYLNGVPTGNTLPNGWAFTNWQSIYLTSGFVPGLNTLTFYVTNGGPSTLYSDTGLRLELSGFASCCGCTNTNCLVSIKCPPSTNVFVCGGLAGATVNYPLPTASSTCGPITTLVCTPPSGSFFPLGPTTVNCTATDGFGNSASCSFTVTVTPAQTPYTVICPPPNLSVTGCPPVMPDLTGLITIVTNCLTPCAITSTQNVAPGTVLTPGTQVVVIVRTCDCQGNCHDCDFIVTAVQGANCPCSLVPVLKLFSGAGPSGVLAGGALDPQFLTGPPLFSNSNPYVPGFISWWWLANSAASKWVGPLAQYGNSPPGVYIYTNRFFLCSTNQAAITGRWAGDDTGSLWLNGSPTANVLPSSWAFTNWTPVSITSGFVPGWNELRFYITNGGFSPTGLRTELRGVACCSSCVNISCPGDIVTSVCGSGKAVSYTSPAATTSCGVPIVSVTSTPVSGSFFPLGTNLVTCTAIDALGNAATCSFNVVVLLTAPPVVIKCPPDQIRYTCGNSAVVYYQATAAGATGPIQYSPPSGSTFPLGTNTVVCTASNACGSAACTFRVVVKPYPLGAPAVTMTAGLPDNFAPPVEPSLPSACLTAAWPGFYWKAGFDDPKPNFLFGHRFTGLPANIIKAELVTRLRPENDAPNNDRLYAGLPTCTPTGTWLCSTGLAALNGGSWNFGNPATTFTLDLGAMNPAVLSYMSGSGVLDVAINDDTTVDYLQLRLWTCPPPNLGPWLPNWTGVGSVLKGIPQPDLPGFGPIGTGGGFSLSPESDPAQPTRVDIEPGGGQAFAFTAVLDMNAPDGATVKLAEMAEPGSTDDPTLISLVRTCQPRCGWNIKANKRCFGVTGGDTFQVSAVNTNGDLLGSFVESYAEAASDSPIFIQADPGVTEFPVTVVCDWQKGSVTVSYPGSVARRLCGGLPCPRGWDGTIKGRLTEDGARKGWNGTVKGLVDDASAITFTPTGDYYPTTRTMLSLSSTGMTELVIADQHVVSMGQEVTGTPDVPVTFQSSPDGDSVSFSPQEDNGGVTIDLGHSSSFSLGVGHFENGDIPTQEQWFRIYTNRPPFGPGPTYPPPPPIDLRLTGTPAGVLCSVDFTLLGATEVGVWLSRDGHFVAYGTVDGPQITPDDGLIINGQPERIGMLQDNGIIRLTTSELFDIEGYLGDEVQLVPGLPQGASVPEPYSAIQCLSSAGMENIVYDLQRVLACPPTQLNASYAGTTTVLSWSGSGYRLLGAETLDGPWLELGTTSPVVLTPNAPQRYFRLVCD
jgi:hypothetical protein